MADTPQKDPYEAVRAVLGQYEGAADVDRDRRAMLTPIEVLPGTSDASLVAPQRERMRGLLDPNSGSASRKSAGADNDTLAASELETK